VKTGIGPSKKAGQVSPLISLGVTDALDVGKKGSISFQWQCLQMIAEDVNARGPLKCGRPSIQGIVISVHHKGSNASFVESLESIPELDLRPEASVGSVVNVSGHQKGIHLFIKAESNDIFKGIKCGRFQYLSQVRVIEAECGKWAVKVKISRVNK
jgi:hypothetical protein